MTDLQHFRIAEQDGFDIPSEMPQGMERLHEYWTQMSGGAGDLPSKRDFDPLALKGLWSDMAMFEVTLDGGEIARVVYRYSSERHDRWFGMSLVGKRLDDVVDETEYHRMKQVIARMIGSAAPYLGEGRFPSANGNPAEYKRLLVPFRTEVESTFYIVGVWDCPTPVRQHVKTLPNGLHQVSSRQPEA